MKWINAIYWLALSLWLSLGIAAGIAALGVFYKLPKIGLEMSSFADFLGHDTIAHGRIAGGKIMEPIFMLTDLGQVALAAIVVAMLAVQVVWNRAEKRLASDWVRGVCLAIAGLLVVVHAAFIAPPMNRSLRDYWAAAEQNQSETAQQLHAEFDARHKLADRLYSLRIGLLLLGIGASGMAQRPSRVTPS